MPQRRPATALILALACSTLGACAVIGPSAIRSGRETYGEAIRVTSDQQALRTIVSHRYAESTTSLTVASITASMRFASSAGFNVGIGPSDNYDGNLVPLSGGVAYEENPTISYLPVDGARHVRQVLSPIPLDLYLLLVSAGDADLVLPMLTDSVNGIRNHAFLSDEAPERDTQFLTFLALMEELFAARCIEWGIQPDSTRKSMVLFGYAPDHTDSVRELLDLLNIDAEPDGRNITIPVYLGVGESAPGSVAIKTRSVYDVIRIASALVDAPEDHVASNLALAYPEVASASRQLHVRSSEKKPKSAVVSIKYQGHWFYVDAEDTDSRLAFQLLRLLVDVRLADTGPGQRAPVLTVPVGG